MQNFTKAHHLQDAYIINGEGEKIKTRFTIISRLIEDDVVYQVSFCSHTEKQFNKKVGVAEARKAPEWSFPISVIEDHNHVEIMNAIATDIVENHLDEVPKHHRRWLTGDNYGSDISEYIQIQEMVRDSVMEVLTEIEME